MASALRSEGGDGESLGFFCHPPLLVDIEHAAALGLATVARIMQLWQRLAERLAGYATAKVAGNV